MIRRALFAVALILATAFSSRAQSVIAQWDFNGGSTVSPFAASSGAGSISVLGGLSIASNSGAGSSDTATPNSAVGLTTFPAQGGGARTAGIEIIAGTAGFRDISLKFDFRASNTGSRTIQVLYTLNGVDYVDGPVFTITTGAAFTNGLIADFSSITEANDNPLFRVRLVSDFEAGAYVAVSGNYTTAGTWRFDMVTLTGNPSGGAPVGPTIVGHPQNVNAFIGGTAQFNVAVSGSAPFYYQWSRGTTGILNATNAVLTLTNLTVDAEGSYSVVVTNSVGSATSNPATLTVTPDPSTSVSTIAQVREAFLPVAENNTNNVNSTQFYTVEGVVTTHVSLTTAGNALFYIQDDTGGIPVFWGTAAFVPAAGDRLRVRGPGTFFNGLLELVPGATGGSVTLISSGNPPPAPRPLPLDALVTRVDGSGPAFDFTALEAFEGSLVIVTNVQLDLTTTETFPNGNNVTLLDSTGVAFDPALFNLRIDARVLEIIGQPKPAGPVNITAVLGQFDSSNPRTTGYQLNPTRLSDFTTDRRPAVVRFTNILSNLVRPGDQPTNSFTELTLLPGETLSFNASISDVDGLAVEVATSGEPAGATWVVTGSGTTNPTVSLAWTASAADAGNAYAATLEAKTSRATNTVRLQLYTPTEAEQGIVITEFHAVPTGDTNSAAYNLLQRAAYPEFNANASPGNLDEYVEIVNVGTDSVELIGWTLADAVGDVHQFFSPFSLVSSNAYVLYGGPLNGFEPTLPAGVGFEPASLGANGRLLALNNGGDTIILRNAARRLISRIFYADQGTNIASQTRSPAPNGAFQLHTAATGRFGTPGLRPGGALWSEADVVIVDPPVITIPPASRTNIVGSLATFSVTASGTPPFTYQWSHGTTLLVGQTNSTLTLTNVQLTAAGNYTVTVGNSASSVTSDPAVLTVVADTTTVSTIASIRALVAPLTSTNDVTSAESYTVEGIVTTAVNLTSGTSDLFYLQDATAGIAVFWRNFTTLARAGDRLRVTAPISFFNGLLQFVPNGTNAATSVTLISADNPLPAPVPLDFALAGDFAAIEALEGSRVVLQGIRFDQSAATFGGGQNVTVTNAAGSTAIIVRIDARATSIVGTARPTGAANVIGVLGQFDSSNPRDTGYQVIPSLLSDITAGEVPPGPITVGAAAGTEGTVVLTWNVESGRTYSVLRSATPGGTATPVATGLTVGTYTDTPGAGTAFFYKIQSP